MWCFLNETTEGQHEWLLSTTFQKREVLLHKTVNLNIIVSGSETGYLAAIREKLPNISHIEPYFHFTRVIYSEIQSMGRFVTAKASRKLLEKFPV